MKNYFIVIAERMTVNYNPIITHDYNVIYTDNYFITI